MNEKMPSDAPPKEMKEKKPEEKSQAYWDARIAESAKWIAYWEEVEAKQQQAMAAEKPMPEGEPKIAEFERLVSEFESRHSLAELHAITHLDPKEAPFHPVREPAKIALEPINALLNELRDRLGKSSERFIAAKTKYIRLSQAVGMISYYTHEVDHARDF